MKLLLLHNRYQQTGGEDVVVQSEAQMLRERGAEVLLFEAENPPEHGISFRDRVRLARSSSWSEWSYGKALELCRKFRPDVAHVHNFWIKLSPSVHAACHDSGVPTVQTLHNFRLLCVNGLFLREGRVCEDCLGKTPWRGVTRRCYRQSRAASAAVASMIVINRWRDTWNQDVDAFITPSAYARTKFIAGNLPAEKLFVKPNVVEDCCPGRLPPSSSDQVIYVGRLSEEKGLDTLLSAWAETRLHAGSGRLLIVGDGPARAALERQATSLGLHSPAVVFAGKMHRQQARKLIGQSRLLVAPSRFESFGNAVIEAFSSARPVVVSDIGALRETVEDGLTGLRYRPGDSRALGEALAKLLRSAALADQLGENARREYLLRYTPERNYDLLMSIYRFAIEARGGAAPAGAAAARRASRRLVVTKTIEPINVPRKRSVLGVGISATDADEVLAVCRTWIERGRAWRGSGESLRLAPPGRCIVFLVVHSVMTAVFQSQLRSILNGADIAAPDGMPLAWALRSFGVSDQPRVYGPDIMLALCAQASRLGHRVFLYGGREKTLPALGARLLGRFPGLEIAGSYAPPFRPLTAEEDAACVEQILNSQADIVFVGIGAPRQERWIAEHRWKLPGVVMLAVGAAFDFHAGTVRQAPRWMQNAGLEWLFRLLMEPKRLWKRYFLLNPLFLVMWGLQALGILKYAAPAAEPEYN